MGSLRTLSPTQKSCIAGLLIGFIMFTTYFVRLSNKVDHVLVESYIQCQTSLFKASELLSEEVNRKACESLFRQVSVNEKNLPSYIKVEDVYALDRKLRELDNETPDLSEITDGRMFRLPSGKYTMVRSNWPFL